MDNMGKICIILFWGFGLGFFVLGLFLFMLRKINELKELLF